MALALGSQETLGIMSLIGFLEGYFEKEVNTFEDFLREQSRRLLVGKWKILVHRQNRLDVRFAGDAGRWIQPKNATLEYSHAILADD